MLDQSSIFVPHEHRCSPHTEHLEDPGCGPWYSEHHCFAQMLSLPETLVPSPAWRTPAPLRSLSSRVLLGCPLWSDPHPRLCLSSAVCALSVSVELHTVSTG